MRFSVLLFLLYQILKWAAKIKPAYRSYLGSIHEVKIMIKTADGKHGRLFIFDQGTVSSKSGANHPYDVAIVWSDAATGFKVMASKSDTEQFKAAAAGKMKLDGQAFFAQWFNDGVKLVM
jgi:putative sterol carrier protein